MKKQVIFGLLTLVLSASAFADQTDNIRVSCRLEESGEVLTIKHINPAQHYGMFATIFSKPETKITGHVALVGNDDVTLNLNVGGEADYAGLNQTVPRAALKGPNGTSVSLWALNAGTGKKEWITCALQE